MRYKCPYQRCIIIAILIYVIFFSVYSVLRHYTYLTASYDLGIFMQSLWTAYHNKGFFFNTPEWQDLGVLTHFGVHNQPILFLIEPIYGMFPHAETLLILQTLALGSGALTLFKFSTQVLGDERKSFYLSLIYLINPLLHGINRMDFHPVSFAVPFIFLVPYYLERKELIKLTASVLLVLSVKEDAGLVLISIGILFLIKDERDIRSLLTPWRSKKNKSAFFMMVIGAFWILLSLSVIGHYSGDYPYLGGKLDRYGQGIHMDNIIVYTIIALGSVGFIPLITPRLFIASLPIWMELYLSSYELMIRVGYPYPYMLLPFLFMLSVYSLKEIDGFEVIVWKSTKPLRITVHMKKIFTFALLWMLLFSPAFHIIKVPKYVNGIPFYRLVGIYNEWSGYLEFLDDTTEILARTNCPIGTQGFIFPRLANRNNTYDIITYFGSVYVPNNSIIFLSKSLPDYNLTVMALENYTVKNNITYVLFEINDIIISCHRRYKERSHNEFVACVMSSLQDSIDMCERGMSNEKSS